MSKSDIVRAGAALGVDYSLTVSCYQADAEGRPAEMRFLPYSRSGISRRRLAGPDSLPALNARCVVGDLLANFGYHARLQMGR